MELTKEHLQQELPTSVFGHKMFVFGRLDSTNNCARALAEVGAEEGTLVITEYQTEGRGRLGRPWIADAGANLLFSLLIRPPLTREQAGVLPFYAAVAIARAVEPLSQARVECKWPNDLLINGRKFGGILLETSIQEDHVGHAILGIGLNVNQQTFSDMLADSATSLARELGKTFDRRVLLHAILAEMESSYRDIQAGTTHSILSEWISRCTMIGKDVAVRSGDEVIHGRALEVRDTGALVLETTAGQSSFFAADVTLTDDSSGSERI
jgi:BirA family biotin operon repressor/biotin-[acetyl-CoA-carboxylase] ligase